MPGKMYLVNGQSLKYWKNHINELKSLCIHSTDGYTCQDIFHIIRINIFPPHCMICEKPTHHHFGDHFRQYCSTTCQSQSEIVRQNVIITNKERYGHDYFQQTDQFKDIKKSQRKPKKEKIKQPNSFSRKDVKEKIKQTNLERYGIENPSQSKLFQEKVKQTCLERYGGITLSSPVLSQKVKQTCLERYGVENPMSNIDVQKKVVFNNIKQKDNFEEFWSVVNNNEWWNSHKSYNECYIFLSQWINPSSCYQRIKHNRPDLIDSSFSSPHQRVINLLKEHQIDHENNSRKIISPLELDIFIPSKNIAIEINGVYWHSEVAGNKSPNYHLTKTLECEKKDIKLLQFWDTEIQDRWDIVRSMILNACGLNEHRIYARKCQVIELVKDQEKDILNSCHLQGYRPSSVCLGLIYQNELVSLMSFGKPRYNKKVDWELLRFCNSLNTQVIGGASKLFKHRPEGTIVSYSDRRYSQGKLYDKLGMKQHSVSNPNYFYTQNYIQFYSRVKYQKHKLSKLLESFDPSLTEWENMKNHGYDRVWDCGNTVWIQEQ